MTIIKIYVIYKNRLNYLHRNIMLYKHSQLFTVDNRQGYRENLKHISTSVLLIVRSECSKLKGLG